MAEVMSSLLVYFKKWNPKDFLEECMWDMRENDYSMIGPKANWEDGELPLTAMSKTVDGAILGEGVEINFGHVKLERNQNTNLMKLRYKAVILILCHDSIVIVYLLNSKSPLGGPSWTCFKVGQLSACGS